jgi:hypothetical protein
MASPGQAAKSHRLILRQQPFQFAHAFFEAAHLSGAPTTSSSARTASCRLAHNLLTGTLGWRQPTLAANIAERHSGLHCLGNDGQLHSARCALALRVQLGMDVGRRPWPQSRRGPISPNAAVGSPPLSSLADIDIAAVRWFATNRQRANDSITLVDGLELAVTSITSITLSIQRSDDGV